MDKSCAHCNFTTKYQSNLIRHQKNTHELVAIANVKSIECEYCPYVTNSSYNMERHRSRFREMGIDCNNNFSQRIICPVCGSKHQLRKELRQHIITSHNETIEEENLNFESDSEFFDWKKTVELENHWSYVCHRGMCINKNGTQKKEYFCHRDGFYKEFKDRKKNLKSQGSNKINGSCPSTIKYKKENGVVMVKFIRSHIGHDENIGRLNLKKNERAEIAGKLKSGVPLDVILDEIRDHASDIHAALTTTTKQDLRNIIRDFNLDPTRSHSDDAVSVEIWCTKVSGVNDPSFNPVVYYKRQGDHSNNEKLNDEDVLLIISNAFQRKMLTKFANNIVCIDSTHGMNQYDFHLTSLVVVDEYGAGIPAAFCISNRKDTNTWSIFFKKMTELIDINILQPKVFMSDDDDSFYNAWKQVIGHVPNRLLCTWHIDRAWRNQLQRKILNVEKRALVYKSLRVLLQATDIEEFQVLLKGFMQEIMADNETSSFGEYFKSYYIARQTTWAYCFRKNCGINTNMRLESLHKVLKYFYLHGQKNKRLDKCIDALVKYSRDCLFKRLRKIVKNERPRQLKNIAKSHARAKEVKVNFNQATSTWSVQSQSSTDILYEVELVCENVGICNDDCIMICEQCEPKICVHTFSCECVDYLIKTDICKHIHATVACMSKNMLTAESEISPCFEENIKLSDRITQNIEILEPLFNNNSSSDIDDNRDIRYKMETLLGYFSPKYHYSSEIKNQIMKSLDRCLEKVQIEKLEATKEAKLTPVNKKVDQQRRLFSTKKPFKQTNGLVKPTCSENTNIKQYLKNPLTAIENVHTQFDHSY